MQRYDVALWLTPFSWWPDYVAFVQAEAASLAVVQLMDTHHLQCVSKAAVTTSDGTRQCWWIWSAQRVMLHANSLEWRRTSKPRHSKYIGFFLLVEGNWIRILSLHL
jgi:hypothetical protein